MDKRPSFDEYLTPSEAAKLLRRSPRTLARKRAEGIGPVYHQEAGRVLYPRSGLYSWLAQHIKTPPRNGS
jgi:hypothetical protein